MGEIGVEVFVWEYGVWGMPRAMRVQYEGTRYHVMNRGNYRGDVFGTRGAMEGLLAAGLRREGKRVEELRKQGGVSVVWLAERVQTGKARSLKSIFFAYGE